MSSSSSDTERLFWPAERIRAYQLERLRETLTWAAQSKFYGPRLAGQRLESLADLADLPLTTKEDVRNASPFGLVAVAAEQLFEYHETFGTTGTPASSWLSREDFDNFATQIN